MARTVNYIASRAPCTTKNGGVDEAVMYGVAVERQKGHYDLADTMAVGRVAGSVETPGEG